jgi:hypothetical protein
MYTFHVNDIFCVDNIQIIDEKILINSGSSTRLGRKAINESMASGPY